MRDKRGFIGRMLTTFPVMLLIIFIMGIFLILSGFVFVIKGPKIPAVVEGVDVDSVLLSEIEIKGEEIVIVDSILRLEDYGGDISHIELFNVLKELVRNDGKDFCLAIAHGREESVSGNQNSAYGDFYFNGDGESLSPNSKFRKLRQYANAGAYRKVELFSLKGENIEISYYYGSCLGGVGSE